MPTGGCFCGAVRYQAELPVTEQALCHCSICRRTAGAPAVAWFSVRLDGFRYTAGPPARFSSSPGVQREFCPRCGAQISFRRDAYDGRIDLTAASLDDPELAAPIEHIWTRSRLSWMARLDALPEKPTDDWQTRDGQV